MEAIERLGLEQGLNKQISYDSEKIDEVHRLTLYPPYFGQFTKDYRLALADGGCPVYVDFFLRDNITPLLGTLSVLDLREEDSVLYRYCGSGITASTGADLTGLNLLDLVPAEGREDLYTDMKAMIAHPCGNFSQHLDVYASGKSVTSESLSLPFKSASDSRVNCLMTLHASEWTIVSEGQKRNLIDSGDMRIGVEWIQSIFVDIGFGTPGPTALQRDQPTELPA